MVLFRQEIGAVQSADAISLTKEYIDGLGVDALEKAANYSMGNHWLLVWGLIVSAAVAWVIIRLGWLGKIEKKFENSPSLGVFLIGLAYTLLTTMLTLPFTLYANWWREMTYGRTSQALGDFLSQMAISTVLEAVIAPIFFVVLYIFIRKAGRVWWLYGGALTAAFISLLMLLAPIYVMPLFNAYTPLPEGEVRVAIEEIADKAGIPKDRIFIYDGSRQSENFTANVAGIGDSARIAISDVALKSASLDEVRAVTGHEAGHYVLGQIWLVILTMSSLAMICFFLTDRCFMAASRFFNSKADLSHASGLPVLMLLVSIFSFLCQPVYNTVSRMGEMTADDYSLETVQLPDALASALVKSAEYRDPRPGTLQEMIFFTHPSVEKRVLNAMEWKLQQAKK